MSDNTRQHIKENLQLKTTDELLTLWRQNDSREWTSQALEVVREILAERVGKPPTDNSLENTPAQVALSSENESDKYHDPQKLVGIASWATALAWVFLIAGVFLLLLNIIVFVSEIFKFVSTNNDVMTLVILLLSRSINAFISLALFVLLRGTSEVIYLIMDIEDNTRRSKETRE